jgi:hypothetical protein
MLKKKVYWKNYFNLKNKKNNVRGFISTFILHVYQNARWNQRKFDPKIIQYLLKINAFYCLKWTPHRVISPITSTKSYFNHQFWFLKTTLIAQKNFRKIKWIVELLMVNNLSQWKYFAPWANFYRKNNTNSHRYNTSIFCVFFFCIKCFNLMVKWKKIPY